MVCHSTQRHSYLIQKCAYRLFTVNIHNGLCYEQKTTLSIIRISLVCRFGTGATLRRLATKMQRYRVVSNLPKVLQLQRRFDRTHQATFSNYL